MLPTLIQHSSGFLPRAIRQEEEIKAIQIDKETDPIPQRPKKLYSKTPRHHKQLQQCAGYTVKLQKSLGFLYTNNENIEKEYMKTIPFTIASKNQIPRIKLDKGCE
jgi:hypothetical protein